MCVCSPVLEEAREAAAEKLMVGKGTPRFAELRPDTLEWGEGERGRGTAGDARSGLAYLYNMTIIIIEYKHIT